MKKVNYQKRIWLNDDSSSFTGSVVAYHGRSEWGDKKSANITFFEVADCHNKIRLHNTDRDKKDKDFIIKLRKLANVANDFADFLEDKK